FIELVECYWNTNIEGHNIFKVVSKLKLLKKPLQKLLRDQGNLHDRVNSLRIELDTVQKALDANPQDPILREEECVYVQAFNEAKLDEEILFKQKVKVEWLGVGDSNSAYFHKTLKNRKQSGRIGTILNSENVEVSGDLEPDMFVAHYEQFFWSDVECNELNVDGLFSKIVPMSIAANMVRNVTNEEIKSAMFDTGDEKALGIKEVVSDNQFAFILGWRISDNILITQELMHSYHKKKGPSRCAFKIDIQKAYDTREKGLRQEDPLSPYLFTLVIEILTLILNKKVSLSNNFRFHRHSQVIMDALEEFKLTSGLVPSLPKSTIYFCNILNHTKNAILNIMPNSEGELLVKYLGVPLISSSLFEGFYGAMVNLLEDSLWVRWIHTYKLRGRSFWDVLVKSDMSWGWRKLLQLREVVKPFFWVKLGHGLSTSLWYDRRSDACLLINFISPRDIHREGLEAIRPRGNQVAWFWIVGFTHNIPLHAFHLWLVMRNGLKTHDRMRQWDVGLHGDLNALWCSLCDSQPDSHTHLFFDYVFSFKVWSYVRVLADMDLVPPSMHDIMLYLQPMGKNRTTRCIFGKLIVATTAYFICNERNNRTFEKIR
nr:hypothetical protein [Tanacetum cinerariifolium]